MFAWDGCNLETQSWYSINNKCVLKQSNSNGLLCTLPMVLYPMICQFISFQELCYNFGLLSSFYHIIMKSGYLNTIINSAILEKCGQFIINLPQYNLDSLIYNCKYMFMEQNTFKKIKLYFHLFIDYKRYKYDKDVFNRYYNDINEWDTMKFHEWIYIYVCPCDLLIYYIKYIHRKTIMNNNQQIEINNNGYNLPIIHIIYTLNKHIFIQAQKIKYV